MSDAHDRLAGLDSDRLTQLAERVEHHPSCDGSVTWQAVCAGCAAEGLATCDIDGRSDEHEHDADELFATFDAAALESELLRRFTEAQELEEPLSDGEHPLIESVRTFDSAGLLGAGRGIVLACDDGSEFQLTIVQSRSAR